MIACQSLMEEKDHLPLRVYTISEKECATLEG
jgi:hypothetical protein